MSTIDKIKSLAKELSNIIQNKKADLVQDHLKVLSREEQMSDKEIFALFTHYTSTGATVIENAISRSPQHLEAVLDNTLVNQLNNKELFNILNNRDSSGNPP